MAAGENTPRPASGHFNGLTGRLELVPTQRNGLEETLVALTRGSFPGVVDSGLDSARGNGSNDEKARAYLWYRSQRERDSSDPLVAEEQVAIGDNWRAYAKCRGQDSETFFPPEGRGASRERNIAKAICRSCVVTQKCLDYALEHKIPYGVWGGTTPRQRELIIRARRTLKKALTSNLAGE